jgi:molybdopterin molybdotransferase
MRDLNFPITPREKVLPQLLSRICFQHEEEMVSLAEAGGRVLARDVLSVKDVPNTKVSALDGIALRFQEYQDSGGNTAGWQEGKQFIFSNTGVAVPDAYDTVVRIENVEYSAETGLQIKDPEMQKGQLIRPAGFQINAGSLVLPARRRLTPFDLSRLASAGVLNVPVFRKPVVAYIPTGDELVPMETPVHPGKTTESVGIMLAAYIEEWGGRPLLASICPDNPEAIENKLREALKQADIVIISGGSSKGSRDCTLSILQKMGEVLTFKVDHGPAFHTMTAVSEGKPILAFVGPPGGAALDAEFYLHPLMEAYLYQKTLPCGKAAEGRLQADFKVRNIINFYARVIVCRPTEEYLIFPADPRRPWLSNAVMKIPGGRENENRYKKDCVVPFTLYSPELKEYPAEGDASK